MALSVAALAGYPAVNTTLQRSAGTPTDAITLAFTNGVYTQSGTKYIAGILDLPGVVPSRLFPCDNNTGGATAGTIVLPTLVSVTQVNAHGQSIQELPSTSFEVSDAVGYAGFLVVLTPAAGSTEDGITAVNVNVPGYTSATPTASYPQPTMRFFVSMSAMLIVASTSTG